MVCFDHVHHGPRTEKIWTGIAVRGAPGRVALIVPCAGVSVQTAMDSLAMEQQVRLGPRALPPASSTRAAPLCLSGHACPPPSPPAPVTAPGALVRPHAQHPDAVRCPRPLIVHLLSRHASRNARPVPSPCLVVQELLLRSQDTRQMSSKQVCAETRPAPGGSQRRLTPVSLLPGRLPWRE